MKESERWHEVVRREPRQNGQVAARPAPEGQTLTITITIQLTAPEKGKQ